MLPLSLPPQNRQLLEHSSCQCTCTCVCMCFLYNLCMITKRVLLTIQCIYVKHERSTRWICVILQKIKVLGGIFSVNFVVVKSVICVWKIEESLRFSSRFFEELLQIVLFVRICAIAIMYLIKWKAKNQDMDSSDKCGSREKQSNWQLFIRFFMIVQAWTWEMQRYFLIFFRLLTLEVQTETCFL